jgi:hypothetical protein
MTPQSANRYNFKNRNSNFTLKRQSCNDLFLPVVLSHSESRGKMKRLRTSLCVRHGYHCRKCSETNLFFHSFDIIFTASIQFETLSGETILLATLIPKYRLRCEKVEFSFPYHEGVYVSLYYI